MATFMLLAYPLIALLIFRALSFRYAVVTTIVLGYVILPSAFRISLSGLPDLTKDVVAPLSALVLAMIFVSRQSTAGPLSAQGYDTPPLAPLPGWLPSSRPIRLCMLIVLLISFATYFANTQPVNRGGRVSQGLSPYDILVMGQGWIGTFLALFVARKYLHDAASHRAILLVLVLAAVFLVPLVLFEIRMSPQLSNMVYGYFPHSFAQHVRGGGFRPVVFFPHALRLAIFLCMAAIAAIIYFRVSQAERRALFFLTSLLLIVVLALSKSFGVLMIGIALVPLAYLLGPRTLITVSAVCALLVFLYAPLGGLLGYDPLESVQPILEMINSDRASSFAFRLEHGERLLAHASGRPLFGWGIYDRWVAPGGSIPDAYWMTVISKHGWVGYFGVFGLMMLPVVLLFISSFRTPPSIALAGLSLVLAANYLDLIPNSAATPITMLIAGATIGYLDRLRLRLPDPTAELYETAKPKWATPAPEPRHDATGLADATPAVRRGEGSRYTRFKTVPRRREA